MATVKLQGWVHAALGAGGADSALRMLHCSRPDQLTHITHSFSSVRAD